MSGLREETWRWRGEESTKHQTALGGELGACSENLLAGDGEGCSMLSWQKRGEEYSPWQDEVML